MICKTCGTMVDDSMQTCPRCGQPIFASRFQEPLRTVNYSAASRMLIATLACIVIAFVGIFTDWLKVKVDLYSFSDSEGVKYSDIFKDDYDEIASYESIQKSIDSTLGEDNNMNFSKTDYNMIKYGFKFMKWGSFFGYIAIGIGLLFLFMNKKLSFIFVAVAAAGFVIAFIGAYMYCMKTNDYIEEAVRAFGGSGFGMKIETKPHIGAWLSTAGAVGASVCAYLLNKNSEEAW